MSNTTNPDPFKEIERLNEEGDAFTLNFLTTDDCAFSRTTFIDMDDEWLLIGNGEEIRHVRKSTITSLSFTIEG